MHRSLERISIWVAKRRGGKLEFEGRGCGNGNVHEIITIDGLS